MLYIDDEEIKRLYKMKQESAKKRLIPFKLDLTTFKALYQHRDEFTCFYTDNKFNIKDKDSPNYPSLERINSDSKGYEVGNVVWCCRSVNTIKAGLIECDKSLRGYDEQTIRLVQRIKKVLNNPDMITERMKPYDTLFNSVHVFEEQKTKEILKQESLEKYEYEHRLAKEFNSWWEFFNTLDCVFALTFKEFRDVMRAKSCRISKKEFTSWEQRSFFVLDKTKTIIEKDNIVLCDKTVQECLDRMGGVDLELLHTVGKSLIKLGE
jgi:hypothetical protein